MGWLDENITGGTSLDNIGSSIDSATTSIGDSISSGIDTLSEGAAGALDSVKDAVGGIGGAISGALGGISGLLGTLGAGVTKLAGVNLPLKNALFDYASYTYVIGLGCLSDNQVHHPDKTYIKNINSIKLICKDANTDPKNRVQTPYGKFDFFIDDLKLESMIGYEKGSGNTNVHGLSFNVTEPYSMGQFILACQTLAQQLGHNNFREAPFILTIEFRGNKETGAMSIIPNTTRTIPFTFQDLDMTVTQNGSVYHCTGMPFGMWPLSDDANLFKTESSAVGKTVQEMLQSGTNSLQAMLNAREREQAKMLPDDKGVEHVPNQYLIMFPVNTSSGDSSAQGSQSYDDEDSNSATTASSGSTGDIYQSLGVAISPANSQLVQNTTACNAIGKATMGFSESRKGDQPSAKDNVVYNAETGIFAGSKLTKSVDPKISEFRFQQDTSITNAICQVILQSDYVNQALDKSRITKEGYRDWFRIQTRLYNITSDVQANTGVKAKLIVYQVVPASVHASRATPPNTPAPGFGELKKQIVKEYNYIYTGKNVDVEKFEIKISNGFTVIMGADALTRTQDEVTDKQTGGTVGKNIISEPQSVGAKPPTGEKGIGIMPTIQKWIGTTTSLDKQGGGGQEGQAQRTAKLFNDCFNTPFDMYNLDLGIIGDPYWIMQSGLGNYTSKQSQFSNLNADGTANYENGEVDVVVNFRTPIDINQSTGLYDFGKSAKSVPVMQFSGIYCVQNIVSTFKSGKFQQTLTGFRRPQQENLFTPPSAGLSTKGSKTVKESDDSNAPPT